MMFHPKETTMRSVPWQPAEDLSLAEQAVMCRIRRAKLFVPERRISVEDPDMRHGRKSRAQRVDGYKRLLTPEIPTGTLKHLCALSLLVVRNLDWQGGQV
jgi:hypothetical protein